MKLTLKPIPIGGVRVGASPGHYVDNRGFEAQIITVGAYRGRKTYAKSLPGYSVVSVEIMATPDPELDGTFISVILRRA